MGINRHSYNKDYHYGAGEEETIRIKEGNP